MKSATTSGISLPTQASPVKLNPNITDQVLGLSDILDINEKSALELMLVAEQQLPRFPDYSRQQVAILLYHDGRQSVFSALRALVQARDGNTWTLNLSPQVRMCSTGNTWDNTVCVCVCIGIHTLHVRTRAHTSEYYFVHMYTHAQFFHKCIHV